MTKTDTARKYRDDYGMEMAQRKLARIMYKDHKLLFKDEERTQQLEQHQPTHTHRDLLIRITYQKAMKRNTSLSF